MELLNLDKPVRNHMSQEIERDVQGGVLYVSRRLTDEGASSWPDLLLAAAVSGTPKSLAESLFSTSALRLTETSQRNGKQYEKAVPINAAETLAEGEFNRFYIRAVCLQATKLGHDDVEVYRAKAVVNPRIESEDLIGSRFSAGRLLGDMRTSTWAESVFGLPPGPNSGLSVKIVDSQSN
ncbi:hypothetical protein ACP3TD_17955 [Pseudarthrobacter sp. 1G09]|uniref:hypothetical protein n=1 Tax=Pseudarthrobacter sp. 1G09 TaxID=3416178 RepID=UPI003CF5BEEE